MADGGLSATFTPNVNLANSTTFTVTVTSGVTDLAVIPNPLVPFTSTFTTIAAGTSHISIDTPASVASGSTFIATVNVGPVTDFDAGQFDVSYDPAVLTIDDISPGAGITNGDIIGTVIPVVGANPIAGAPGTLRVVVNLLGTDGVSGSGFLAKIQFRVIGGVGTSSAIGLTNVLVGNNVAQEIPSVPQGTTGPIAT